MKFINFTGFNGDHLWNVYMLLMVVNLTHHLLALDLAVLFLIYLLLLVQISPPFGGSGSLSSMRRHHILFLYIINTYDFDDLIVPLRHIIYDSPLCLGSDWRGEGSVDATSLFLGCCKGGFASLLRSAIGSNCRQSPDWKNNAGAIGWNAFLWQSVGHQIQLADFRT